MNVRNYIREFNPRMDLLSNNMRVGVFGEHLMASLNVDDPYFNRFYIGYIVNTTRDDGKYGIEFTEYVDGSSLGGLAALGRGFNVKENNIYILKPGIDWVNYQSEQSVQKMAEDVDEPSLDDKDDRNAQIDEILEQEDAEENNRPRETPNEVLSKWYKSNTKKINRLSPEKKDSVENAVLFFLKRYSKPEPITTQIEQDDFSFLENFDPQIALVSEIEGFDLENLEI